MTEPRQSSRLEIDQHGVARLTLLRPEVHNAFDDLLIAELNQHLENLHIRASRDEVRVVVLASEGKSFSAGADLKWMQRMVEYSLEDNLADSRELARLMQLLDELPCPSVCRVQGATFGGAVGLAACCDIVIAAERARFCLSEVRIGLAPAVISPYVQRAIGSRQMRRYALSAEVIDSVTAQRIGLVHETCPDELLEARVTEMVQTLLATSPAASRATKALLSEVAQAPASAATRERCCEVISQLRVSEQGQAGLAVFFAGTPAPWVPSENQTTETPKPS